MTENIQEDETLYMVQMWLSTRGLVELARMLHLPIAQTDQNYITHCALGEIFGEQAPGPYCLEQNDGKHLRVLAYSTLDGDSLRQAAKLKASPTIYNICDWSRMATKPMPDTIPTGTHLKFELRACPVVRKSSAGKHHNAGVEVDAFLSRVWEVDDPDVPVDREEVYRGWLTDQLEDSGAARPLRVTMERFSLERMIRRAGGRDRKTRIIKRPDVTLTGRLQVSNPRRFDSLLRSGVGRHTSFGYGMLKLRPAGR